MNDLNDCIQSLSDEAVAAGRERGVQAVVYVGGARVVDAWAGVADAATGRAVDVTGEAQP